MGAELDVDETDLQILNLLYSGLPDAAVGRRLGIGHRTVQRRVRDLMTKLEANSRVALGARAQELGLLNSSSRSAHSAVRSHLCASPTVHTEQIGAGVLVWHVRVSSCRVVEAALARLALPDVASPAVIKVVVQAGCDGETDQVRPETLEDDASGHVRCDVQGWRICARGMLPPGSSA